MRQLKYIILILILILFACNPQAIRKARLQQTAAPEAQADSFLYYQTVTLENTFLDSMSLKNDSEQSVFVRLLPPPPPPAPKTKQVDGFRVQVFAGLDSLNALTAMEKVKQAVTDSIYFLKESSLFKIQFGDYLYRNSADLKALDIRKHGISGAWVVLTRVNVPIDTVKKVPVTTDEQEKPFKIQILVTSSLENAKTVVEKLKTEFKHDSFYLKSETVYKVFLGRFSTRNEAEKTLTKVKQAGYSDAWMVHKS